MLGIAPKSLNYYWRRGLIPPPRRCLNIIYYTRSEAEQIKDWWESGSNDCGNDWCLSEGKSLSSCPRQS